MSLENFFGFQYKGDVYVGSDKQKFSLVYDTGSAVATSNNLLSIVDCNNG